MNAQRFTHVGQYIAVSLVAMRPVLGLESETVGNLSQEHLGNADPVCAVGAGEQRLQLVPAHEPGDALVHPLGRPLEDAVRDVAVQEGEPLQEEPPRRLDAFAVRTPMVKAVLGVTPCNGVQYNLNITFR